MQVPDLEALGPRITALPDELRSLEMDAAAFAASFQAQPASLKQAQRENGPALAASVGATAAEAQAPRVASGASPEKLGPSLHPDASLDQTQNTDADLRSSAPVSAPHAMRGSTSSPAGPVGVSPADTAHSAHARAHAHAARGAAALAKERRAYADWVLKRFRAKLEGRDRCSVHSVERASTTAQDGAFGAATAHCHGAGGGGMAAAPAPSASDQAGQADGHRQDEEKKACDGEQKAKCVGVREQVDALIWEATSADNLARMYEGWIPWV